jgi:hypothetical protein
LALWSATVAFWSELTLLVDGEDFWFAASLIVLAEGFWPVLALDGAALWSAAVLPVEVPG